MFTRKRKAKKSQSAKKTQNSTQAPSLSRKELAAQKRKTARDRKELISFTSTFAVLGTMIGLAVGLIKGDPKFGIVAIAGIVCLALSFKYPRTALWAFLIYMPFSGTITYWIGNGNAIFHVAKDAFYIPALIALVLQCRKKRQPILIPKKLIPSVTILLTVSFLTLLFVNGSQQLAAKPGEIPILLGMLGLKVLVGYIPLIFCAYYLIRDQKDLLLATRLHVILALMCCSLGFVQYMMLVTGICPGTDHLVGDDLFKATLEAKCLVGGSLVYSPSQSMIRLPGTFVAPWQWGWFLIANTFFTFASAFGDPSLLIWRPIGLLALIAVFINAVISGQRIALALVPIMTLVLIFMTGKAANLKRFLPIALLLSFMITIGVASNPQLVQERVNSFVDRWNASPPTDFIQEQVNWSIKEQKGFLGSGVGRATNSARTFGETKLVETFYPKLLYEIGPLGVTAFLGVVTTLTVMTYKAYHKLQNHNLRVYGTAFWVFILFISYNTYYYPLDVDPVAVYYWFFAGVALKLPDIDKQEQEKLVANDPETNLSKKNGKVKISIVQ